MSSSIRHPKSLFLALTAGTASAAVIVACGGSPPGDPKSAEPKVAPASGSEAPPAPSGQAGGAGAGSTTDALPPGGELQGAKLGSSSHSEVETKGDAGPKAGPNHVQEPGRRREDIQAIVMARRDEARACYDKGLKDHPGIEGNLTIKFVIDPQGTVTDASVDSSKSSIHEPAVGTCVADIIKKIKFAPSKGGFETRANYPFDFHPKTFGKADAGAK